MSYHITYTPLLTKEAQLHLQFTWLKLISDIEIRAKVYNVSLEFINERSIAVLNSSLQVNGYFNHNPPTLSVAYKQSLKNWTLVLLHESCHMDQWIENASAWKRTFVTSTVETNDLLDLWLDKKITLNPKQLNYVINTTRDLELDCEKRAVKKIRKYNLPVDIDEYVRRANAYVCFYTAMKKTRRWYTPGNEPYNNEKVWKEMPTKWLNDYNKLPKSVEKVLLLTL